MKNRKVLNVRCHVGAGIQGRLNYSHFGPTKKADGTYPVLDGEIELWPIGAYVVGQNLLIPFTNITSLMLAPEDAAPDAPETEKRGPGRPPKAA
jgi:hypothetical protein